MEEGAYACSQGRAEAASYNARNKERMTDMSFAVGTCQSHMVKTEPYNEAEPSIQQVNGVITECRMRLDHENNSEPNLPVTFSVNSRMNLACQSVDSVGSDVSTSADMKPDPDKAPASELEGPQAVKHESNLQLKQGGPHQDRGHFEGEHVVESSNDSSDATLPIPVSFHVNSGVYSNTRSNGIPRDGYSLRTDIKSEPGDAESGWGNVHSALSGRETGESECDIRQCYKSRMASFNSVGSPASTTNPSDNLLSGCSRHSVDDRSAEEKYFVCLQCGAVFDSSGDLTLHMQVHTDGNQNQIEFRQNAKFPKPSDGSKEDHQVASAEKPFECRDCGASFKRSCDLKRHARTHTGERPFVCGECSATFSYSYHLKEHMLKHTGEKLCTCSECGSSFSRSSNLKRHMRTHTGEKPYECQICKATFTQSSALKIHMYKHTGVKPFECGECGASFNESSILKAHMYTHTGKKPFECGECGSSFTHACHLKIHMRKHTGENPFECDECGASFYKSSHLKVHVMSKHTNEKPFMCGECGESFIQKGHLKTHMLKHSGEKSFMCRECGASFGRAYDLKRHLWTHTDDKPFVCDICKASFVQSSALKIHMCKHTGDKPFECGECGEAFIQKGHLKMHMLKHTGEKPFVCGDCGASFNRSYNLTRHMQKHSKEKTEIECEASVS